MKYILIPFILLLSIITLLYGVKKIIADKRLISNKHIVKGKVTRIDYTTGSDDSGLQVPVIEFKADNVIDLIQFKSRIQKGIFTRYDLHEEVNVIYENVNGDIHSEIYNTRMLFISSFTYLFIGLSGIIASLLIFLFFDLL
jgi:hypothetical protein